MFDLKLKKYVEDCGSQKEAAAKLGISPSVISKYLSGSLPLGPNIREKLLLLEKRDGGDNSIVEEPISRYIKPDGIINNIRDSSEHYVSVFDTPVYAGEPRIMLDHEDRPMPMKERFFCQVRGDSMKDSGIADGDMLLMRRSSGFVNGDIILARISDKFTLKRVKNGSGFTLLNPDNEEYQPIKVDNTIDWECIAILEYILKKPAPKHISQ